MEPLDLSNAVVVMSLVLGLLGTVAVNYFGRQKDRANAQSLAEARRDASEAALATETIRADNLKLQLLVERERTARLELESAVAPRRLSEQQKESIKTTLGGHPASTVRVMVFIGAEDGGPFALDLLDAIRSSGWTATDSGFATIGGDLRGVWVVTRDEEAEPAHAAVVLRALQEAGIAAHAGTDPERRPGEVLILISPKR